MDMKNCDECNVNNATVHLTQIVDNEVNVTHLCEECAQKKGISIVIEQVSEDGSVNSDNIVDSAMLEKVKKSMDKDKTIICTKCNMSLAEFKEKGWLGCASCYTAFEKEISELLVQVHGDANHNGKVYKEDTSIPGIDIDIRSLRNELDNAIKNEKFELAAVIRDKINSLLPSQVSDGEQK